MSSATGKFIDLPDSNESATDSDANRIDGNKGPSRPSNVAPPEPEPLIGFERIEPSTIPIDTPGDAGPRRTKSGTVDRRTKAGRQGKEISKNLDGLTVKDLLVGICGTLQVLTGVEEFEVDEDDKQVERLADATEVLSKELGHTISPKAMAWTGFFSALGAFAAPRIGAYQLRKRNEKASRPPAPGRTVQPGPQVVTRQAPPPTSAPPPKPDQFPTPQMMWNEPLEGL